MEEPVLRLGRSLCCAWGGACPMMLQSFPISFCSFCCLICVWCRTSDCIDSFQKQVSTRMKSIWCTWGGACAVPGEEPVLHLWRILSCACGGACPAPVEEPVLWSSLWRSLSCGGDCLACIMVVCPVVLSCICIQDSSSVLYKCQQVSRSAGQQVSRSAGQQVSWSALLLC